MTRVIREEGRVCRFLFPIYENDCVCVWGGVCLVCVISRLSRVWNVLHAISSFSAIKIRRILLLNMYSYCIQQQQQQLVIMVIYPPISFDLSTGENPLIWALVKILWSEHWWKSFYSCTLQFYLPGSQFLFRFIKISSVLCILNTKLSLIVCLGWCKRICSVPF